MKKSKLIKINNFSLNHYFHGIILVFNGRLPVTNHTKILLNKTFFLLKQNQIISIESNDKINTKDYLSQYNINKNIVHIRPIFIKKNISIDVVLLNKLVIIPEFKWTDYLDFYTINYNEDSEYDLYEHIKFNTSPLKNTHLQKSIFSDNNCIEIKLEAIYNSLIGDQNVLFNKNINKTINTNHLFFNNKIENFILKKDIKSF
jgi:hypothetical protein